MGATIAVVGYCASGKTTLVAGLRKCSVDARSVAQEHSIVRDLWNHSSPDVLVFLDVDLAHIRLRRNNPSWPGWIRDLQQQRLAHARKCADVVIDTSGMEAAEVLDIVLRYLQTG